MTVGVGGVTEVLSEGSVKAPPSLGFTNYAILVAQVINVAFIPLSLAGVFGLTNSELSGKYQTLVSPDSGAFLIWQVIFVLGTVAAIVQMLPKYRGSTLVATIAPWWVSAVFFQCVWTVLFAQEFVPASTVAIVAIAVSLYALIISADNVTPIDAVEFWTIRAGFSIYAGWLTAASIVNANVSFDYWLFSADTMLAVAVFSLAVAIAITTVVAVYLPKPDAGIPLVIAWATYWINKQLNDELVGELLSNPTRHNPFDWRVNGGVVLSGLAQACNLCFWSALVLAVVAGVLRWKRSADTTVNLPK